MKKSFLMLSIVLLAAGCATLDPARKIVDDPGTISGTYTLLLLGGSYGNDPERMAILDLESEPHTFAPVVGPGRLQTFPGLSAAEALVKTDEFFRTFRCSTQGRLVEELNRPGAGLVGYQVTPDYPRVVCEFGNKVLVDYSPGENGVIKVYTRLMFSNSEEDSD